MEDWSGGIVKDSSRQGRRGTGCEREGRRHIGSQFIMSHMTERVEEERSQAKNL